MKDLQRITTLYDDIEDRLCLKGQGPQGQVQVLWLTQRMLNRVLPHLTGWLEQQGGAGHGKSALHADLLQEFQQQAAVANLEPGECQGSCRAVHAARGCLSCSST